MASERSLLAALAYWVALAGLGMTLFALAGIWLGVLTPLAGFGLFALGTLGGGTLAALLGAIAWLRIKNPGRPDHGRIVLTLGIAAVLLGLVLYGFISGGDAPPINDITTDLVNPPEFAPADRVPAYADRDMSYPSDFIPIVLENYPDLKAVELSSSPNASYRRALAAARGLGWVITDERPSVHQFDAQDTTAIFRFVDDITVRIRPNPRGSLLDIRSKSRDGQGDLGANAARIKRFETQLAGTK